MNILPLSLDVERWSEIARTMCSMLLFSVWLYACGAADASENSLTAGEATTDLPMASATADHDGPLVTILIDSLASSNGSGDGTGLAVFLRRNQQSDTIPVVLTSVPPILVGDTVVLGFHEVQGVVGWSFRYHLESRQLDSIPPFPGLNSSFSEPAFSPDGLHIAYIHISRDGFARSVVRSWPAGIVVYRGPDIGTPPSDFVLNGSKWDNAEDFEVFIDVGGKWHRERGSIRTRLVVADTVGG